MLTMLQRHAPNVAVRATLNEDQESVTRAEDKVVLWLHSLLHRVLSVVELATLREAGGYVIRVVGLAGACGGFLRRANPR